MEELPLQNNSAMTNGIEPNRLRVEWVVSGDNGEEAAGGETMGDGAEAADFRKWEGDGMVEGSQMTGVRRVE